MKKIHVVPLWWIAIAVILFTAGMYAYLSPNSDIIHFSRILGIAMFIAGGINIGVCSAKHHIIHGVRWLEADGLATVLFSLFPLFNDMIFPAVIPFFFGVWELVSGVLKLSDTAELKHDGMKCWIGFAFISSIELFSGTMSLLKPVEIAVGFNHVIGIIFFVQSMGFLFKAFMYRELIK